MLVVIEPCFAEGHMLEAHIRNTCEYLEPTHFIICEGLFPTGPEDSLVNQRMVDFRQKYTLDGTRSFDIEWIREIVAKCQKDYSNVDLRLVEMEYPQENTAAVYYRVYTYPTTILPMSPDAILLPHECDMFFTKEEAEGLLNYCGGMVHGKCFGINAQTFFESPQVAGHGRARRGMFRYGDGTFYHNFFREYFYFEARPSLRNKVPEYLAAGWHYEWLRPDPYFDMRIDQTHKHGVSGQLVQARKAIEEGNFGALSQLRDLTHLHKTDIKIEDHPPHIHDHPNFKKYYG